MEKINVLVIYTDTLGGVGFYRSTQPHRKLVEMYPDEFNVDFETMPMFDNLSRFDKYQIIHFHKGVFFSDPAMQDTFTRALEYFKEKGIVTIMDIDDYWVLGGHHPQGRSQHNEKNNPTIVDGVATVKKNFSLVDYVTTTTQFFRKAILPFNKNVVIFENAIDPTDPNFIVKKEPHDRLRIGFIMGSTHEYDMMLLNNFVAKLPQEILDKVDIVLCGFDTRGTISTINPDGKVTTRNIKPEESVWYRYEQMVTNNYKIVSPEHKAFLLQFTPQVNYPNGYNEHYRRFWTKTMDKYYQHYKEIDVLFAPLEENAFNEKKSELKPIECCFSHTAFVGSNFAPYTIGTKNLFKKGGEIDPDGNAILIDKVRCHKDWAKAVEKLVKHPEYVKMLQDNLYRDFHEKYDLRNVTKRRAEWYREIIKK